MNAFIFPPPPPSPEAEALRLEVREFRVELAGRKPVEKAESWTGMDAEFSRKMVPETALLGREGDGWNQVTNELAFERGGQERFLSYFVLLSNRSLT